MSRLSVPGRAFLQCAFAPPDFNVDPGQGIPDNFNGKTLMVKHVCTQSISPQASTDAYFVIAPTPGIAYWQFSLAAGTAVTSANAVLTPFAYSDYESLFGNPTTGTSQRASNVEAFRYASTAVGIYPTSNFMQYGGSISIWKGPIKLSQEARSIALSATSGAATVVDTYVVNGLEALSGVGRENYAHSFIDGAYTIATNAEADFPFSPIMEGITMLPQPVKDYTGAVAASNMFGTMNGPTNPDIVGMGTMDAIFIKVTTAASATNSFVLKTWACVEYRPQPNSLLYQYAGHSPPHDPVALDLYRAVAARLPPAVVCADNARFWEMVQRIIRGIATAASYVPGPVGLAGKGLGMLVEGISALAV